MDDEIDLRYYLSVLFRRWQWLIVFPLGAMVLSFAVLSLLPKSYESRAAVAVVRSRTDVSFDPRIRTTTDEGLQPATNASRLQALVALVRATEVAEVVRDQIGTALTPEEREISRFVKLVEASNNGDIIYITARYRDPVVAQQIANLWAVAYEEYVNEIYGVRSGSNLAAITAEVADARAAYGAAQADVEAFLAQNQIAQYDREIGLRQQTIESLQQARSIVLSGPVDLQVKTQQETLSSQYADLAKIEQWLAQARSMYDQIVSGSDSSAQNFTQLLSLIMLESQIYGGTTPIQLQLDATGADQFAEVRAQDVLDLITVLEERRTDTQARIDALQAELEQGNITQLEIESDHPLSQRISALDAEIRTLQSSREAQEAQQRLLQQERDQAWETYQTLRSKQTEDEIAANTSGTEVQVASSAVLPTSQARPVLELVVIAGFLAFVLAIFVVFAYEWWRQGTDIAQAPSPRPLQPEPTMPESAGESL